MKFLTVSGPPGCGKTSVILKALAGLPAGSKCGVVKFDCLSTFDDRRYRAAGHITAVGLSGSVCPDHYYVTNIEDCLLWGIENGLDYLISESAGLCNRCSPHIRGALAVCMVDVLSGVETPRTIGPMLKLADVVVVTKGDIVSQAEREVFAARVAESNPAAEILFVNGLTGQGVFALTRRIAAAADQTHLIGQQLRFCMPAAMCTFCYGETRVMKGYRNGNIPPVRYDAAAAVAGGEDDGLR